MTDSTTKAINQSVKFLRKRDYLMVRELGQGACGQTVLLLDDVIDEHFVCKKYHPHDESVREELFVNFLREIKLLHQLNHKNVVRVFNYYVYPDEYTGYILMEFVNGTDIQSHIKDHPEHTNQLFLQAVSGFDYMEEMGVLHRDIRPLNLMVDHDGDLKIIDLGFGKRINDSTDFDKSITLNWWCEKPDEFATNTYDYTTEVYFVGKLFEKLILENNIENFQHKEMLRRMCVQNPKHRIQSFSAVAQAIRTERFPEINFTASQTEAYRQFAESMSRSISKIEYGAKYHDDVDKIVRQLADGYRACMLEEIVPDAAIITRCFIDGVYYYKKNIFPVQKVKDFLDLLQTCNSEQRKIVIANLNTKLDTILRYSPAPPDDDIPF